MFQVGANKVGTLFFCRKDIQLFDISHFPLFQKIGMIQILHNKNHLKIKPIKFRTFNNCFCGTFILNLRQ